MDERHPKPARTMKHRSILIYAAILSAIPCFASTLKVWIESAPSPSGPWTRVDIDQSALNAAGQLVLPEPTAGAGFFRTAIDVDPSGAPGTIIPHAQIPSSVLAIAEQHLSECSNTTDPSGIPLPSPWTGATIAEARPVYDAGIDVGQLPAFLELKVVKHVTPGAATPIMPERDAGFILVSLTTAEKPVVCFSMSGRTPLEDLEFATGRRPNKVFRYGPAYLAAEDDRGELIQGLGTCPLRIEMGDLAAMDTSFGISAAGSDLAFNPQPDPPGLPAVTAFSSHAELKTWWITSPLQMQMRRRRAGFAQVRWDLDAGRLPGVVTLHVGETRTILQGSRQIVSHRVDADPGQDGSVQVVSGSSGGGAMVTGMRPGSAPVYLLDDQDHVTLVVVVVGAASPLSNKLNGPMMAPAAFKPGWQPIQEWRALDYSAQPNWKQFKSPAYCALINGAVGCGPMAWTIVLGWFEHQGVSAALGNPLTVDTILAQNNLFVTNAAHSLHSLCNTHCVPFTGEGATFPWDMDGGLTLVDTFKQQGFINWNANAQWETFPDSYNASAKTGVTAIKAGRPALLGLWGMMHYAVAYSYWHQLFQITSGGSAFMAHRWFVCNMGFGSKDGVLYPADDIFYGLNLGITKK